MSFDHIRKKVEPLLPEILAAANAYLVDVSVKNDGRGTLIRVLVDTDSGITIDECARVSRELGRMLEVGDVLEGSTRLEVSSPGLDQPLKLLRQYAKNVGRRFVVHYRSEEGAQKISATLEQVEGDTLHFVLESRERLTLPFERIIESKEILPW